MKMKKMYAIPLFVLVLAGIVLAGTFIVNNFTIKADVYEPFDLIQHAVLGDGGNWNGVDTCEDYQGVWTGFENGQEYDVDGLYAGEGRMVCTRITNLAEADIPFTISSEILNTNQQKYDACLSAFGEHSMNGTALASSDTISGVALVVDEGAEPVEDCRIGITITRG